MSKRSKKEKAASLPATLYVTREYDAHDEDESYLIASESTENIDADATVGIYELTASRKMRVERTLE